jgi:hypothetical protein
MMIKFCLPCKFHEIKKGEEKPMSYCARENCWSQFSKCVANKALNRFLEQESSESHRPFSAVNSMYPIE